VQKSDERRGIGKRLPEGNYRLQKILSAPTVIVVTVVMRKDEACIFGACCKHCGG
jgi:hypothetical protein